MRLCAKLRYQAFWEHSGQVATGGLRPPVFLWRNQMCSQEPYGMGEAKAQDGVRASWA